MDLLSRIPVSTEMRLNNREVLSTMEDEQHAGRIFSKMMAECVNDTHCGSRYRTIEIVKIIKDLINNTNNAGDRAGIPTSILSKATELPLKIKKYIGTHPPCDTYTPSLPV